MFSVGDEAILVTIGLPNTVGTAGFIVCLVGVPALGGVSGSGWDERVIQILSN